MRNYVEYGDELREYTPNQRQRFILSMNPKLLKRVDNMTEILNASRPDVIEIMVAFYFTYVKTVTKERSEK